MRVVPLENEDVNECWIADRDRFLPRGAQQRRPPDRAHDQAGRPVEGGRLEHRARVRRDGLSTHRQGEHGAAAIGALLGSAARTARRTAPAGQAGARPGQRERRPPPAPRRFPPRAGRAGALAGHAHRRAESRCSACAGGGLVPAQGPSRCSRSASARRRARARRCTACTRSRRLADAGGTRIVAAPSAWLRRWPTSPRPSPAARADRVAGGLAATRRCRGPGHRRSCCRRAQGRAAGNAAQQHPASFGALALAATGSPRKPAPASATSARRQQRRRNWSAASGSAAERRPDARSSRAEGLRCCSTSSRRSMAADAPPARRWAGRMVVADRSFKPPRDERRRDAADRAVHRDRRHLRQRRRPRAEFHGVVAPLGETRPAWKVLRVLATCWNCRASTRDLETCAPRRWATAALAARLDNRLEARDRRAAARRPERVADVPIYAAPIRWCAAPTLQTPPMRARRGGQPADALWQQLGLAPAKVSVRIAQGGRQCRAAGALDATLAANTVACPPATR